jgi:hypothetical protein
MLKNLLNLLPPVVARYTAQEGYDSLRERGHVSTWSVAWKKNSSLVRDGDFVNDDDDDLVEFNFDDFDFDDDSAQESPGIEPDYIKRHIARIPQYGDNSRWRLAEYLNMFDNLSRDGSLTNEQRQAVDYFVAAYQPASSEFVEGDTDA